MPAARRAPLVALLTLLQRRFPSLDDPARLIEEGTVLVNGVPNAARGRGGLFFQPSGPGFARVTVIDSAGAADSVMVRLDDGRMEPAAAPTMRSACAPGACARP